MLSYAFGDSQDFYANHYSVKVSGLA